MPFVAVLWLACLGALSLASPIHLNGESDAAAWNDVAQSVRAERRMSASRAEMPDESLRVAVGINANAIARLTEPATRGRAPAVFVLPARLRAPERSVVRALGRHGVVSYALAAHGSILPYFPTAPPRQA